MQTHNFHDLKVWQASIDFVERIYQITSELPSEEKFGLISQIRRAAISIPSNIAEGSGRGSDKDFARFLAIALSSSYEVETHLVIIRRLGLMSESVIEEMTKSLSEIQKMAFTLHRKFEKRSNILLSFFGFLSAIF
jgi:four helix bundle protein